MVQLKENLVKLTDYPFSYSLIGLIVIMIFHKKLDLTAVDEFIPLLLITGIIGTILSISDPIGSVTKLIMVRLLNSADFPSAAELVYPSAITYEIDKLVSMIYLLIILLLLIIISINSYFYEVYINL